MTTYFRIDQPGYQVNDLILSGTHGARLQSGSVWSSVEDELEKRRPIGMPRRKVSSFAYTSLAVAQMHIFWNRPFCIYEVKKDDIYAPEHIGSYSLVTMMLESAYSHHRTLCANKYWQSTMFGATELVTETQLRVVTVYDYMSVTSWLK